MGAKLQLAHARVHRLALVVTECRRCGTLGIYLNGQLWRKVATRASATRRQVLLTLPALSLRAATVELRAMTRKRVFVDGIGVSGG